MGRKPLKIALLSRFKKSAQYRIYFSYYRWLRARKIKKMKPFELPAKKDDLLPDLVFVVQTSDIPLLHWSLRSMCQCESVRGNLVLIGDTDASVKALTKHFNFLKDIEILSGEKLVNDLPVEIQRILAKWRASRPFGGYAKKFGATLALNLKRSFILSDADVLWHQSAWSDLLHSLGNGEKVVASEDVQPAFDPQTDDLLEGSSVYASKPLNCGFIYYPERSLIDHWKSTDTVVIEGLAEKAHSHLEQTIIAKLAGRGGLSLFPITLVETSQNDIFCFTGQTLGKIRHYAGAKDLFWRDV